MKLNQIGTLAGILALIITVLSYVIRIETQFTKYDAAFDLSERVSNLEKMLYPVLVELEVKKRLEDRLSRPEEIPLPAPMPMIDDVQSDAEDFVEQRIQSVSPEFRKEDLIK